MSCLSAAALVCCFQGIQGQYRVLFICVLKVQYHTILLHSTVPNDQKTPLNDFLQGGMNEMLLKGHTKNTVTLCCVVLFSLNWPVQEATRWLTVTWLSSSSKAFTVWERRTNTVYSHWLVTCAEILSDTNVN